MTLLHLFEDMIIHRAGEDVALAIWSQASSGEFFVEGKLKSQYRFHGIELTANWDTAFHGSHLGALYSVLQGRLEAGPRPTKQKRSSGIRSFLPQAWDKEKVRWLYAVLPVHRLLGWDTL